MPRCGSQITLCDVPIRFDTYAGCDHGCVYCFSSRKREISKVATDESAKALRDFINGKREPSTRWCDWDIPLHWGGMSDPFQPVEQIHKRSLECLEVFAETQYPFIVSTKNALIGESPYLELIRKCNCVVQFSACSPRFDSIERGASTYEERLAAAAKITPYRRVNIRIQPYIPAIFKDVIEALPRLAEIGIHGVILEGMKYQTPAAPGLIRSGRDWIYPIEVLESHFVKIRKACHETGLKFYCGENRLRALSDELCCCGVEGLGWRVNTANLNHLLFDPDNVDFTKRMEEPGTADPWRAQCQSTLTGLELKLTSYRERMEETVRNPYPYYSMGGGGYNAQQANDLRLYLKAALERSGRKMTEINKHLGNYMASHYFNPSQWALPTADNWTRLQEVIPIEDRDVVLNRLGFSRRPGRIYGL